MESTAFFEKKINLTPREFNEIKSQTVQELLTKKAVQMMEEKCSEHGFVLPGTIKMLSHSMGHFEAARFTGDAIYYVKLEGRVIYPADGIRVTGEVIRKNKMGLYINHRNAIRIQVPRDLHLGNQEYDGVQIGDQVEVELKRSKFAIQDAYILSPDGRRIAEFKKNNLHLVGYSSPIKTKMRLEQLQAHL
jgi:DNA-directed RNA polymerase subunit E'/Rpb7